jgi:cytochrome-b5 reductase
VFYVLDKPPASWTGGAGYVTPEMLATRLPAPGSGAKVLVCGPPGLMGAVSGAKVSPRDQGELAGALAKLGYSKDEVFKF